MEEEFIDVVPCSTLAVDSIIRIGTAGALWGLCNGPYNARKQGLNGVAKSAFVAKSVGKSAFQCGFVAGIFSITHCAIQRYRRRDDWVNGLVAGGVAGAAIAARTRNWRQVIGIAGFTSAIGAAADYSRSL